jgi:N-methylhydantoinase A
MSFAIGVDIGGTFTDCAAVDDAGRVWHGKAPSTHGTSPVEGVLAGLTNLAEAAGQDLGSLLAGTSQFSHGTTIGTNLVVEHKGARVGLITTKGHRDALLMMRGRGRTAGEPPDRILNVRDTDKPAPLVPRHDIVEVVERVASDGSILVQLDEVAARKSITELLERGVEAIAVSLLWSFRNPSHEVRLREIVKELSPQMYVSASSEIAPRQGEFERTVATVINSYLGPASSRYLGDLRTVLGERGLSAPPFIMQANGGVMPVQAASRRPVLTIGSGPAGGLAATAAIAARAGHSNVIATDMGGTSFEVGLVVDGRPVLATENVIEKYTFVVSHLDVRSIACGGGSIARIDPHSGGLQVGPDSAGSDPGPASYGVGEEATVTDADVVLGLIDPEAFLGGRMKLDAERAADAIGRLARASVSELSLEEAAAGVLRVNANNAATLIRQRTIEQGLDPRDFTLYAFGGAGPVHAFMFAEELGVSEVLIPLGNGASTLSAFGIAVSDAMQVLERECSILAPFETGALRSAAEALEAQAIDETVEAGFSRDRVRLRFTALARYAGQYMHEVPLPMDPAAENLAASLERVFVEEYTRLYGAAALSASHVPEIFALRVTSTVSLGSDRMPTPGEESVSGARASRSVFWPKENDWLDTVVHDGAPPPGIAVSGPALIQLPNTTIAVAAGQELHTDQLGNCVLVLGARPGAQAAAATPAMELSR